MREAPPGGAPSFFPLMSLNVLIALSALVRQSEWRLVVDHVDHDGRFARPHRRILNNGIDVTEARIIGARHDACDGRRRAFTLIDTDVELLGGEIALVLRPEIPCVHALELPIEGEAKLRDLLSGCARRRQCKSQRQCSKAARQRHGLLLFVEGGYRISRERIRPCAGPTRSPGLR